MLVQDVMTVDPVTVNRRTSVKEALALLARRRVTALPVLEPSGRLYGIVSEADLIGETVARDPRAQERPIEIEPLYPPHAVEEVCTRSVVSVRRDDDVAAAVELMTSTGAKSLPVLDDDQRLVGIVSRSDVVAALARSDDVIAADIDAVFESLGHGDWLVDVQDGAVEIAGPDGVAERSLAHVVAHTVLGVIDVRVSS